MNRPPSITVITLIRLSEIRSDPDISKQGTKVRLFKLRADWDDDRIDDLQENLARLVSPFSAADDFMIYLTPPGEGTQPREAQVESPHFLHKPKYAIRGHVDRGGEVKCRYQFRPISEGKPRSVGLSLTWKQIYSAVPKSQQSALSEFTSQSGPFDFELRAWDISANDTLEISERFEIAKSGVRKAISAHKGISVYRDGILVLPKSDDARDWLGLDLRRVSRVGTRLSTSQIVGYVSISKRDNPDIEDTSDRERLASNPAVRSFQEVLKAIVGLLENERDQDRRRPGSEESLVDLFEDLTADNLLAEMVEIASEGATVTDVLPMLRDFNQKLDRVRASIQKRLVFYSRLATVGTIAQMLIHEIRNRTTIVGRLLRMLREHGEEYPNEQLEKQVGLADRAVDSLERLADRFAPLATRNFRRGKRRSVLEDSIESSLELTAAELRQLGVKVKRPTATRTRVVIDPGELEAVLLNLLSNALYWLAQVQGDRRLQFTKVPIQRGKRIRVYVHDSGPGVSHEDAERIFWPGVTRKPGGIGMGLTVASEIIAEHGGNLGLQSPGKLGGATFLFDVPVSP